MLLALSVFLGITFILSISISEFGKWSSRALWTVVIVFAVVFSLNLAYASVSSVWVPRPSSDIISFQQNTLGEYQGTFPYSELSYPLALSVYHTPESNQTFDEQNEEAYGQVRFNIFLASANIFEVNGTFHYFIWSELQYKLDFVFSDSQQFFDFLVALYAVFNMIGALIGIAMARTLCGRFGKGKPVGKEQ
ncbi:MAG: hypothetical protein ABR962_11750 [Candidatus Bathyarchaeia archaeon]|jgi:hypothetical protein